jgi:hypothetical protein
MDVLLSSLNRPQETDLFQNQIDNFYVNLNFS